MSETTRDSAAQSAHDDIPRMESWLAVMMLAFIPGIGLFVLPVSMHVALYIAMAVLGSIGVGMFLRSEMRKNRH